MTAQPIEEDGAEDDPHILYRFYDAEDKLLYVGITKNPKNRFQHHGSHKDWFKRVTRSTMEHFTTRAELMAAEMAAIQTECPEFNIVHSPRPKHHLQVEDRTGYLGSDANRFGRTDAIACPFPSREEQEAHIEILERHICDSCPPPISPDPCIVCGKYTVIEDINKYKCLRCLNSWTTDETPEHYLHEEEA